MNRHLLLVLLMLTSLAGFSGKWTGISSPNPQPAKVTLVSSSLDHSVVKISLAGFYMNDLETVKGTASRISLDNSTPILDKDAPDLPKITASVAIPDLAEMEITVVSKSFRDFGDVLIPPSRGTIMRDTDPSSIPLNFGSVYSEDRFYPGKIAELREPHIIAGFRGQTMIIYPFRYNPVTRVLRVYNEVTVEIRKVNDAGRNPLIGANSSKSVGRDMLKALQRHFLNSDALNYTALNEYGNLLVICHGPFMNEMQPYVNWKRASGYHTDMVSTDSTGHTTAQIKTFITNYYNTKGLTHVLLVGDQAQVPTFQGAGLGGPSDNAYGYLAGDDHYADVYIGRFSAENTAQVQTQVQRTLDYEMNPQFTADDWFTTVIGIASDQGPGDDDEMDYQHVRNQQNQLLGYKYTWNPELFDGSQGGHDAAGNPTTAMVSTEVNNGAGLILYTGHGSTTSWGTSGFSNTNVAQLTNTGKLPFIWSVACVNGNFLTGTCFAESWLRASQNGQPTGAIAFLGSTINQSWNSPMEGQDEMTDILAESFATNIKRTFAGLSIGGCMKMIDSYGMDGSNMADTWTIFGDPTIMVRTSNPTPLVVTHDTVLMTSDTSLLLTSSTHDTRATITIADSILATGIFQNDTLMLTFPPLMVPNDSIYIVVTGYNNIPYQAKIPVRQSVILPVSAGFTGVPEQVMPGRQVSFSDTSSGTVTTREWLFDGGTPAVSAEKHPLITYSQRGVFDVRLVVGNGITTDTLRKTAYITCDFPTAVGGKDSDMKFTVSPNPSTGSFSIQWTGQHVPSTADFSVFNAMGEKISERTKVAMTSHDHEDFVLTGLPAGLYYIKIEGLNLQQMLKLVVR